MSGIAAIVAAQGQTIDRLVVARMLHAQRHRGPDGSAIWIDGPVALGYCQLAVTPEAAAETQPATNPSGDVTAVLDGRIDNRRELLDALRVAGAAPRGVADVDILLCAYDTWGDSCVVRLLGDFAFAIWDGRRRALVCAR